MIDFLKSGWQLGKGNFSTIFVFMAVLLFLGYTIGIVTGTSGSFGFNSLIILFSQVFVFRAYKLSQSGQSFSFTNLMSRDPELTLYWGRFGKTLIIQSLLLLGLFLLLIIPGIIYSIYWIFSIFTAVDNKGVGKSALDFSKSIITGGKLSFWTVFGALFTFSVVQNLFILASMIIFPPGLLFSMSVSVFLAFTDVYFAFVLLSMYLKATTLNQQPQPAIQTPFPQAVAQV